MKVRALLRCTAVALLFGGCAGDVPRERGGAPAEPGVAREDRTLDTRQCEDVADWWQCARGLEQQLIADIDDVDRAGDTIVIRTASGGPVRLADAADEHGVGHQYLYHGYSRVLDAHLVDVGLYEGRSFLVVARQTGRRVELDAPPVPSPEGEFVATASWDTEAAYDPNRLRVLRVAGDSLVLEWEIEPESWGPDAPRWLDDSTLVALRRPAIWHPDSTELRTPLTVRRRGGTWSADTTPRR